MIQHRIFGSDLGVCFLSNVRTKPLMTVNLLYETDTLTANINNVLKLHLSKKNLSDLVLKKSLMKGLSHEKCPLSHGLYLQRKSPKLH